MPDDDTMLAQGTVDFRNEGRRYCNNEGSLGRTDTVRSKGRFKGSAAGVVTTDETPPAPAFCTSDDQCGAEADQHLDGCPVEERLERELGF